MPITAKSRAQVALRATTVLEPPAALAVVKQSAGQVKGGGKSLLTSGLVNLGAQVNIEREGSGTMALSITSGKRLVELCTFSARATVEGDKTVLLLGGLETYKTTQPRALGFVPAGPKSILGYDPYRRFLDIVDAQLRGQDPSATITIAEPTAS